MLFRSSWRAGPRGGCGGRRACGRRESWDRLRRLSLGLPAASTLERLKLGEVLSGALQTGVQAGATTQETWASGWQGNDGFQTSDNPLLVRKNRSAKLSILSTSAAPFRIVQSPASHYGEGTKRVSDRSSSSILLKRRRPALRSVC